MPSSFTSFGDDRPMLRAMVADKTGVFYLLRCPIDEVNGVIDLSETTSMLSLKSGIKIVVDMAADKLEKSVFHRSMRDSNVLDLTKCTGASVTTPAPELADDFAQASGKSIVNVPLTISLFARKADTFNFLMFTFSEDIVEWSDVDHVEEGKNGVCTKMPLKAGNYGAFGEKTVMFDMPRGGFMQLYNQAKMEGKSELDLRPYTRRIAPDGHKPVHK